jgi:hypothetical protein
MVWYSPFTITLASAIGGEPPNTTMGSRKRFYTLREMPIGFWSTAMLKKLTFNVACKVQGILNEIADRHVNG